MPRKPDSSVFQLPPEFIERYASPDSQDEVLAACLNRIRKLVHHAFPHVEVRMMGMDAGGRIDLLAHCHGFTLGRSFVFYEECVKAYEADPENCSPIDEAIMSWIAIMAMRRSEMKRYLRKNNIELGA